MGVRSAATFVEACHEQGLYMLAMQRHAVRAVFYLDITPDDVEQALGIATAVLQRIRTV